MKTAQTTGNNKRSVLQDRPKIVVVMPAYNAAETLEATFRGIDRYLVDEIILVDDHSKDSTVNIARKLGVKVFVHAKNRGYGGNQKTCYREALRLQANIVVMLHPDGQYHPSLMGKLIQPILSGQADVVLGSRMLKPGAARRGGMPFYKYVANKALTAIENVILRQNLSEYHTGYRAFSREFLQAIPSTIILTVMCSTRKCWYKRFTSALLSMKFPFRHAILTELPPRRFGRAPSTGCGHC